jgi:multiple sugar transport system substrate-binding protein
MTINKNLSRRALVGTFGATALTAGVGARPAFADPAPLRVFWWGSQERIRRTTAAIDAYQKLHPEVSISGLGAGSDYWAKFATQMAGRNLPDIVQLDSLSIADYSNRHVVQPLEKYRPKPLALPGFTPSMLELSQYDGHTFGVPLGMNAFGILYDETVLTGVKFTPPDFDTDWKSLGNLAVEITKAVGKPNYYGLADGSGHYYALDTWLLQRSKSLFKEAGGLGFSAGDITPWFEYWSDLRKRGGCVSAEINSSDDGQIPNTPLARGMAAMDIEFSNYMVAFQTMSKNTLGIAPLPNGGPGAKPGLYYRPSLIFSIASTSKNPEQAARFIDWFVTSEDAAKLLGVERGVPVLPELRNAIAPYLSEPERKTIDYLNSLNGKTAPYKTWPPGANEFDKTVLRPTAQLAAFGKLSSADAAQKLIEGGASIF